MRKFLYVTALLIAEIVLALILTLIFTLGFTFGPVVGYTVMAVVSVGVICLFMNEKFMNKVIFAASEVKYAIDRFVVWFYTRNDDKETAAQAA